MVKDETEISEEKRGKPRLELLKSTGLYKIELCNPVKDQINKIKVCGPNIEINPCNPMEQTKCIPDASLIPYLPCYPIYCVPVVERCEPEFPCEPGPRNCDPDYINTGCIPYQGCNPELCVPFVYGGTFHRPRIQGPTIHIDEIAALLKRLTLEIEALKRKIEQK